MDDRYNAIMNYVIKNYNSLSKEEKLKLFSDNGYIITYDEIRKYKPSMEENYNKLTDRVYEALDKSNLEKINEELQTIKDPCIVSGVGGSYVVSTFATKILESKNNIVAHNTTLRDINHMNLKPYKNLLICSYGGHNYGVSNALKCDLNKYVLSKNDVLDATSIKYDVTDSELSFISLAATLIPMTILLQYYLDGDASIIKEILDNKNAISIKPSKVYEILSGIETNTAHTFLESTFTESGLAIPVVHDKYDYCHGRSNLNYFNKNNSIIIFNTKNELDNLYLNELNKYYDNVIKIDRKYEDDIVNDYYFTYQSMLLTKQLAKAKNMDISNFDYCPFVKKLYKYKGEM